MTIDEGLIRANVVRASSVADLEGVGYSFSTLQTRAMNTIKRSGGWFGIPAILGGVMLLAAFAAIFRLLFSSRTPSTTTQPLMPFTSRPSATAPSASSQTEFTTQDQPSPLSPAPGGFSPSEWTTYQCSNIYTLDYPRDWYLWPQGHGACRAISLSSTTRLPSLSPDCYIGADGQIPNPNAWTHTINGYKAYIRSWDQAPDGINEPHYRQTVYLQEPATGMTCALDLFDTPGRDYLRTIEQILATFRFVNPRVQ